MWMYYFDRFCQIILCGGCTKLYSDQFVWHAYFSHFHQHCMPLNDLIFIWLINEKWPQCTLNLYFSYYKKFFKILFFPFSPQSSPVHSCIFFVVGPSSCSSSHAVAASHIQNRGRLAPMLAQLQSSSPKERKKGPFLQKYQIDTKLS